MTRRRALWAILVVAAGCAGGGTDETAGPPVPVSLGEIPPLTLRAGVAISVDVPVEVAEGYHVQANPAATEFLVPLELALDPTDGFELAAPIYPPPGRHRLEGAEDDLLTYEDTVAITFGLTARSDASPGERLLRGSLRYQACDATRCYFPATLPVELRVFVEG